MKVGDVIEFKPWEEVEQALTDYSLRNKGTPWTKSGYQQYFGQPCEVLSVGAITTDISYESSGSELTVSNSLLEIIKKDPNAPAKKKELKNHLWLL